jgi:putative ABC transport system permease protein
MGLKDPIGQTIQFQNGSHPVIGVVKDMVMDSPYSPGEPTVFFIDYGWKNYVTFRVRRDLSMREAMARIQPVFKKYDPETIFDFKLTDEVYARKFAAEEQIGNLAAFFTTLALFISCLGLFGLASFVAEQRTKEIGVRKVLGATLFNLWSMLSKDFVLLVVISCLIAVPLSSYFLSQWLEKYEYHTKLSWGVFALTGIGALLITLSIVSYQTMRAARANPARSLRAE